MTEVSNCVNLLDHDIWWTDGKDKEDLRAAVDIGVPSIRYMWMEYKTGLIVNLFVSNDNAIEQDPYSDFFVPEQEQDG